MLLNEKYTTIYTVKAILPSKFTTVKIQKDIIARTQLRDANDSGPDKMWGHIK